jgi:rfaE bifunctional protein kinase chain/domain
MPQDPLDRVLLDRLRDAQPQLNTLIDRFSESRVLVAGDLTLDEFLTGEVERISREAPVVILRHESTRQIPGGGANAVYNLAKLGAQVTVAGIIGSDIQGEALRSIFEAAGIDTSGIVVDRDRPTVTKTRISGHARQSVTQQMVRVDRKSDAPPPDAVSQRLANFIAEHAAKAQAVVCSDYGDGVFSPATIAAALTHSRTIVDAQTGLDRYQGATIFTPNLPEAELASGVAIVDAASLQQAGETLLARTGAQQVLITRGDDGMTLFDRGGDVHHVPAFNRTDVFDVTGAGDTVAATLTLAMCSGATLWEAIVLGNLAASLVVRHFGTATTSQTELKTALTSLLESASL